MPVGLPSRVVRVAALAAPDDGRPTITGIVSPGFGDASAALEAAADRLAGRGTAVLRMAGRRLERDHVLGAVADLVDLPPPTSTGTTGEREARELLLDRLSGERGGALLVDDAQWLDPGSLRVLVGVAERADERGVTLTVAHRPAPGDPALAALDAALSRRQALVVLGPLDDDEVAERAALVLGAGVEPALVDLLAERTAGTPGLVERLARAWADAGFVAAGRLSRPPDELASPVVEAIRAEVDQLPAPARTVLAALSAGAELDDELLRTVTGLEPDQLGGSIDLLRSAGLIVAGGEDVVPVVAEAVTALTPVAEQRRFHLRLAQALVDRGAPPMQAAEHLAAADARGADAAAAYIAAGEASLAESAELARAWFDRAAEAGAAAVEVAAWQAEATALDGDPATALRLADLAIAEGATDGERARAVVAALLPGRGFWRRSAAAYAELCSGDGPHAQAAGLLQVVGGVAAGDGDVAKRLPDARAGLPTPAPFELEALAMAADGLVDTLAPGASGALSRFLESAELLQSAHKRLVLPDTPHGLGATVALALSELGPAEHLLRQALDHGAGGELLRDRHRLLLGWVGLRAGRWAVAQTALDETRDRTLAPREALLAAAIEAGLARRSGDLARLSDAWGRGSAVLLHHPADLLSLEVIGELAIAASRLGHWDQIAAKARELGDVVRALGSPPLWLLPLRWMGLQVALASDDHDAAVRRAGEVAEVEPVHPRLRALADAARMWVEILGGNVSVSEVGAAASGLQDLGLTWEASRLTGQAAIRASDPTVTRTLLEQARDLKAALPSSEQVEMPASPSVLSEREQAVAQYVVDGLTHKEIGAQLYISPKTVEHHVAKIRQKLGASTRAEMLAALRSQLSA